MSGHYRLIGPRGNVKMTATEHARGRVVTVAVSRIVFMQPVTIGDTVCCYTKVARLGRTSITTRAGVNKEASAGTLGSTPSEAP